MSDIFEGSAVKATDEMKSWHYTSEQVAKAHAEAQTVATMHTMAQNLGLAQQLHLVGGQMHSAAGRTTRTTEEDMRNTCLELSIAINKEANCYDTDEIVATAEAFLAFLTGRP